jgi:hypothetical protein
MIPVTVIIAKMVIGSISALDAPHRIDVPVRLSQRSVRGDGRRPLLSAGGRWSITDGSRSLASRVEAAVRNASQSSVSWRLPGLIDQ